MIFNSTCENTAAINSAATYVVFDHFHVVVGEAETDDFKQSQIPDGDCTLAILTIVYWRDIPAQIIVNARRKSTRRELSLRFTEAIDMCALKTGIIWPNGEGPTRPDISYT